MQGRLESRSRPAEAALQPLGRHLPQRSSSISGVRALVLTMKSSKSTAQQCAIWNQNLTFDDTEELPSWPWMHAAALRPCHAKRKVFREIRTIVCVCRLAAAMLPAKGNRAMPPQRASCPHAALLHTRTDLDITQIEGERGAHLEALGYASRLIGARVGGAAESNLYAPQRTRTQAQHLRQNRAHQPCKQCHVSCINPTLEATCCVLQG